MRGKANCKCKASSPFAVYDVVGKKPRTHGKSCDILYSNKWSLALALVVFQAFTFAFAIVTFVSFRSTQSNNSPPATEGLMCLPCSNIEPAIGEDEEYSRIYKSLDKHMDRKTDIQQCCAGDKQKTEFLKIILKKISMKTSRQPSRLMSTGGDRLSSIKESFGIGIAHAQKALSIGMAVDLNDRFRNKTCSLDNENTSRFELSRGVIITKEGIGIQYPGLYFVYKNINFFPDSNDPCKNLKDLTFKSFLIRQRSGLPTVLLTSPHTCCPDCVHDSETGFAGGVFKLQQGDLIQVNVTGSEFIHVGRDVTYLGLVMMGGQQP